MQNKLSSGLNYDNLFVFSPLLKSLLYLHLECRPSGRLEGDREKQTGPLAPPDSTVLFHILNRGLWDQQVVDAPQEASSRAIRYSAVMGERLWSHIAMNSAHVSSLPAGVSG